MNSGPDLVRLEIPGAWDGAPHPRPVGRALNAWLFGELARVDAAAASALHEMQGVKPFTVALAGDAGTTLVVSGYGPCAGPVATVAKRLPSRILLDGQWWVLTGPPVVMHDTWAGLGRHLVDPAAPQRARFEFLTPTAFHSRGRSLPLPIPELVLGGLLQRWARWSAIDLGEGAAAAIAECPVLVRFRGSTRPLQLAGHYPGFTGEADLAMRRPPPAYAGLLAMLATLAPYTGIGQKVGMGMGCVRSTLLGPMAQTDRRHQ